MSPARRPAPSGGSGARALRLLGALGLAALVFVVVERGLDGFRTWYYGALDARPGTPGAGAGGFTILAVNDVYRVRGLVDAGMGGPARLRTLRAEIEGSDPDVLVLLAGDFLAPSLMSVSFAGEQMVDVLNHLDGDASRFDPRLVVTFGNHEFDAGDPGDAQVLTRRIRESQFVWLGSDLTFRAEVVDTAAAEGEPDRYPGVSAPNLQPDHLVNVGGVWVGIFSLTLVDEVPAYLDADSLDAGVDARIARARRLSADLRARGADFVIALTHLPLEEDVAILRALAPEGPDLVVGGHEHDRQLRQVQGRYVVKADADAASVARIRVEMDSTTGPSVSVRHVELTGRVSPDPRVQARADLWEERLGRALCEPDAPACLADTLGRAVVPWDAEEWAIRSRESPLGNWIADRVRDAATTDLAVVNAGALRLNQDLPRGAAISRRHIEELAGSFENGIVVVPLSPDDVQAMVERSSRCVGQGAWLHVSGIGFARDSVTRAVQDVRIGGRALAEIPADTVLRVATLDYLAAGGDGYSIMAPTGPRGDPTGRRLRDVIHEAVEDGVGVDGAEDDRIRNAEIPGPVGSCS